MFGLENFIKLYLISTFFVASYYKIEYFFYQALPALNFEEIFCEIGKANKLLHCGALAHMPK